MSSGTRVRQRGAVLVMALVMLAVLTLVGVASMDSSSLELKVAGNTQQYEIAFQNAQSVIALVTNREEFYANNHYVNYHDINTAIQYAGFYDPTEAQPAIPTDSSVPIPDVPDLLGVAEVVHVGCTAGIGDSLEEGKGQKYNFFDVTASGYRKINGDEISRSVQVQGVRYFAAGCG